MKVLLVLVLASLLLVGHDESAVVADRPTEVTADDIETIAGRLGCEASSDGFRAIQIRTGNSVEGYLQVKSCFAESDFHMTRDGVLVSAHDGILTGNCGRVAGKNLAQMRSCTLGSGRHIATLEEFLSLPLTEWYIDLKSSIGRGGHVLLAVQAAVAEIQRLNRQEGAVLMLYNAPPEVVRLVQESGVRAALKQDGALQALRSVEAVQRMVVEASRIHFEAISVDIEFMDRKTLALSEQLGVRSIVWDTHHLVGSWETLIEAGLTGLIIPDAHLAEARQLAEATGLIIQDAHLAEARQLAEAMGASDSGGGTPVWPVVALAGLSAMVLGGIFIWRRRRT